MQTTRYQMTYTSGATGFQREENFKTKAAVAAGVQEVRHDYAADVRVWDNVLEDHVFVKPCLSVRPTINLL